MGCILVPERNQNDVYMCVVSKEETEETTNFKAIPVSYNIYDNNTAHALPSNEAPDSIEEFIDKCLVELDNMFTRMVDDSKKAVIEGELPRHEFFVQMVANLQNYPVELKDNLLASLFVAVLEEDDDAESNDSTTLATHVEERRDDKIEHGDEDLKAYDQG